MPPATDDRGWFPKPKRAVELYDPAARCKKGFLLPFPLLAPMRNTG